MARTTIFKITEARETFLSKEGQNKWQRIQRSTGKIKCKQELSQTDGSTVQRNLKIHDTCDTTLDQNQTLWKIKWIIENTCTNKTKGTNKIPSKLLDFLSREYKSQSAVQHFKIYKIVQIVQIECTREKSSSNRSLYLAKIAGW